MIWRAGRMTFSPGWSCWRVTSVIRLAVGAALVRRVCGFGSVAQRALAAHVATLEAALLAAEGAPQIPGGAEVWGGVEQAYDGLKALIDSVEAELTRPRPPWQEPSPSADETFVPAHRYEPGTQIRLPRSRACGRRWVWTRSPVCRRT